MTGVNKTSTSKLARDGITVGLDLGDHYSQVCLLDEEAEVIEEARIRTSESAFRRKFTSMQASLVVMEAGTHSPWVSRLVESLGHTCLVADPAMLSSKARKKNDRVDAQKLARWGRSDPKMLRPITHRNQDMQAEMSFLMGRKGLVEARTKLINTARGLVKAYGARLPECDAGAFADKVKDFIPESLQPAVQPLLNMIEHLTAEIKKMDRHVDELADKKYRRQTGAMQQISGVGPLISMAFVLVVQDPRRFQKSRDVGPYLGLTRREAQSGEREPELRISKAGNKYMRKLLVNGAHYILGRFGPDCDLRRWGLAKAKGGSKAKKRAVVAVARKLAVLMHRLWLTGEVYEPLLQANRQEVLAQA
jgi:transposase